jgi:hypothetical protein
MFSDIVSDSIYGILDALKHYGKNESVYPRNVVINMLTSMYLTAMVSDARGPDGSFFNGATQNDLYRKAHQRATKAYDEIKQEEQDD